MTKHCITSSADQFYQQLSSCLMQCSISTTVLLSEQQISVSNERKSRQVVKVKGTVVPVLNKATHHEDLLGEWRYSSTHS
jgi:hypothetical protein